MSWKNWEPALCFYMLEKMQLENYTLITIQVEVLSTLPCMLMANLFISGAVLFPPCSVHKVSAILSIVMTDESS